MYIRSVCWFQHLKTDDHLDDDEIQDLVETSSGRDSETITTERGYEADSEFTDEENKNAHSTCKLFSLD